MDVDLIEIFEDHIKKGLTYCCICLRSEKETRLVDSKHVLQFTSQVNLHRSFVNLHMKKACYMCEAHAQNALRMYQACVNAIAACTLVKQLQNIPSVLQLAPRTQQAVRVCNTRLKNVRASTSLRNTEVLVIDSTGVRLSETFGSGSKAPAASQSFSPDFETVVLDDDDDDSDPLSTAAAKKSINTPTKVQNITPDTPFIATDELNRMKTNQIMFIQNDENQTIPVLIVDNGTVGQNGNLVTANPKPQQMQIQNGRLKSIAPKTQPVLQNMQMIHTTTTNTYIVQPEELAALFNQNRNSKQLSSQSADNDEIDKILSNKLNSLQSEAKKAKPSYVVDIDTLNKMIVDKGDSFNKTCTTNKSVEKEAPLAVISKVVSEAKVPVPKEDAMVDFEDKIPMDVISFVDATYPNATESILPDPAPNQFGNTTRPPAKRRLEQVIFTID